MENNMLGHNNPPSTPESLHGYLQEVNAESTERAQEALQRAAETPDECADDEMESVITDRIGAIQKLVKALEAKRVDEKKPYLELERVVDGFFNPVLQKLEVAKKRLSSIGGAYKAKKAEEARQRALEEAARQRREREEAERKAAEEARLARELREEAERVRQEAERKEEEVKREAARQAREAERLRQEADDLRKKQEANRIQNEKEKEENERRAKELDAQAKAQEKTAKETLKSATDTSANSLAKELDRQAKAAEKSSEQQINTAVRLEKQENKSSAIAEGRQTAKVTSHGAYGSQGSLRVEWKGVVVDRNKLPPEVLFQFIADDAIQTALNRWLSANGKTEAEPKMAGARFYRDERMQVRA